MAHVDYFLKIDGVEGESYDAKHRNEIELQSWSWGEHNAALVDVGGGMGSGKVSMGDFNFVMPVNKASGKLLQACATGEHFQKAVLTCRKAGKEQQEYLTVTLSECLVSSFQTGGSASAEVIPVDQFSLAFSRIEHTYKVQKADGSLGGVFKHGYDIKTQRVT
jgi:type VI secretion system secreted protein Hcp